MVPSSLQAVVAPATRARERRAIQKRMADLEQNHIACQPALSALASFGWQASEHAPTSEGCPPKLGRNPAKRRRTARLAYSRVIVVGLTAVTASSTPRP